MKNTSKQAYRELCETDYLTKKQKEVYNLILICGAVTGSEVNRVLKSKSGHKRLSELKQLGLICEAGEVKDETTGKMVYKWDKAPKGYIPPVEVKRLTRSELEAVLAKYTDGHISSDMYDAGYLAGWTACINSLCGSIPVHKVIPTKVWE